MVGNPRRTAGQGRLLEGFVEGLAGALEKLIGVRVLVVGDVVLDRFVHGSVDRVSPEAPIPILRLLREEIMLGGAGNVARNLATLDALASVVAAHGDDAEGEQVARLLAETTADARLVRLAGRPTSLKTRYLSGNQQLLRTDREDVRPLAAAQIKEIVAATRQAMAHCQAVVLSDYGKGALAADVVSEVIAGARGRGVPVVVDPVGDDYAIYRGADVLTPNRKELQHATRMAVDDDAQISDAARHVVASCGISGVLVTRGADGMSLVVGDDAPLHLRTTAREVYDVSGAGDTVVAVLGAGLAVKLPLPEAVALANCAGGIAVGKSGTAAVRREEIARVLDGGAHGATGEKIMALDAVLDQVGRWRRCGLAVGLTNGCFDLLHPGHVSLFEQARAACDRLIVALNTDASVRRLKGDARPVQGEDARAHVIAALAYVDAVVTFDEDTPIDLIRAVRPDVLIKGADYRAEDVVGADIVQAYGGRLLLAELTSGQSSSSLIARAGE